MLVISSFKFSIFKTRFLYILIVFRLTSSFKDSSLAIQSQLLAFRFSTEVMLSDKWCSMLFIVISLSDAVLFGSSELTCSSVKLLFLVILAMELKETAYFNNLLLDNIQLPIDITLVSTPKEVSNPSFLNNSPSASLQNTKISSSYKSHIAKIENYIDQKFDQAAIILIQ